MGSNLRHGPESSGICIKKSKMYRNISKSFKIYSKSSSNRPKISRNFWILPSSSQKQWCILLPQDVLTPDTFSFGCFHCSISSVKTSSLTKLAKGQGASTGVFPPWESYRSRGGVIFCIEIWLFSNMFHVKIEGLLSCESASWSSEWLILEPPSHFWNHKTTRTTCIMGVTRITALLPEELKGAKQAGLDGILSNETMLPRRFKDGVPLFSAIVSVKRRSFRSDQICSM